MIVKMKFLSITGPKGDIDRVVNQYLSKYEIHLENALSELTSVRSLSPYLEINPYRDDLAAISQYYVQLEQPEKLSPHPMSTETALETVHTVVGRSHELEALKKPLDEEISSLSETMRMLRPFRNMDFNLTDLLHFKHMRIRFGRIDKQHFAQFEKYVYSTLDTIFHKCDEDEQYVWGLYFCPINKTSQIDAVYASMHFELIKVPDSYEGTGRQIYESVTSRYNQAVQKMQANENARQELLRKYASEIVSAKYALECLSSNFDIRRLAACTSQGRNGKKEVFYIICGWMAESDAEKFQKDIENDSQIFCIIEDQDGNIASEPPTKLKNPRLFQPFEMYIKMYGLPAYHEMDPTMFVGLTYSFIFGTMFGDVGQGLLLLLGGALLYKLKGMALAGIISLAGIFSTLFGFLYGSVFGFENVIPALWLHPKTAMTTLPFIGSMNTVFVVAIAFGMFLILTTMIFHIVNAVRTKNTENLFFDQNSLAGLVFYGSAVAVIFLFMTGHRLPAGIVLAVMFGIPLLLIMFKEPLTRLVQKKSPLVEGGIGMYLLQSFFETFEVLLSYFSNTLSFVRMGAFAVSHAAMMEVVLMLAGAANGGNPNWLIIVFGNLFVCAMEGLIVGIQVLRLEYYEMFSRFYSGSGREFKPFLKKTLYR